MRDSVINRVRDIVPSSRKEYLRSSPSAFVRRKKDRPCSTCLKSGFPHGNRMPFLTTFRILDFTFYEFLLIHDKKKRDRRKIRLLGSGFPLVAFTNHFTNVWEGW